MAASDPMETAGHERIPNKGDRIELVEPRLGVFPRGTVFYSDQLQILVKWDDGRSESLRPGGDRFRIIEPPPAAPSAPEPAC